ncbi:uncharacterized mitochondrial protein-like protein [Tanacetum coccineum]
MMALTELEEILEHGDDARNLALCTRWTCDFDLRQPRFGVEYSSSKESDNSSWNTNLTDSLYPYFQKAKGFHTVPLPTGNSMVPSPKEFFYPSAVLTREGLKSTARPKMTQTVPSKRTAKVFYQGTARPRVPQAVLSQSTGRPYYPRMDNIRPRTSSFSPSTRSSTTRTPHRPQRPKKIMKSIWVKKESTVGSQAVLPQNVSVKGSAMIKPTQTWRPKGAYLDSVNRDNGSYTLKQFEAIQKKTHRYAIIDRDLKNIIPSGGVTCLVAKATKDEAVLWHRRLGHVNFKNINKLVKGNLVRGLPSKTFKLDHSCLACRKGKQHRASCKKIEERTVREPYEDETYDMLHDLIVGLENKLRHKVKTIRCDHGTEFKNHLMNEFCAKKGIKREYSIARTPQQNGVAERKNRTLIEAARTMLADSLLPIQFWGNKKSFKTPHIDFLENQENQKGKGPDWMFDFELLTPSMNYIPVRKENYGDSGGKVSTYDDEQALHDEPVSLMHQESIAKTSLMMLKRNSFKREKRRKRPGKGKENSDDDVPKDGVFSTNSFDDEYTDNEEDGVPDYNNMDHPTAVSSTP